MKPLFVQVWMPIHLNGVIWNDNGQITVLEYLQRQPNLVNYANTTRYIQRTFCTERVRQLEAWQACTYEPDSSTLFEKRRECNPSLSFPVSALPVYISEVRNLEWIHVHCQKATWRSMRCHTIAVHCTGSTAAAAGCSPLDTYTNFTELRSWCPLLVGFCNWINYIQSQLKRVKLYNLVTCVLWIHVSFYF